MILDLLLGAVLILFLVSGWRSGFIRSFFGLVGFAVSLILTKLLYLPFTSFLFTTPLYQKIAESLNKSLQFEIPPNIPPVLSEALGLTDVATGASTGVLTLLTYVVLFILIFVVLSLATRLLEGVFRLPLLNFANRFLGLLFNGFKGIMLFYLLGIILQFFRGDIVAESVVLTYILSSIPNLATFLF